MPSPVYSVPEAFYNSMIYSMENDTSRTDENVSSRSETINGIITDAHVYDNNAQSDLTTSGLDITDIVISFWSNMSKVYDYSQYMIYHSSVNSVSGGVSMAVWYDGTKHIQIEHVSGTDDGTGHGTNLKSIKTYEKDYVGLHHYTVILKGRTPDILLYVDGVLITEVYSSLNALSPTASSVLTAGRNSGFTEAKYAMYDLSVFNYLGLTPAYTDQEIADSFFSNTWYGEDYCFCYQFAEAALQGAPRTATTPLSTVKRDSFITRALRVIGVIPPGQSPAPYQIEEAAEALTEVIDNLSLEGFTQLQIEQRMYSIPTTSVASYGGKYYRCIRSHTSSLTTKPALGSQWALYWVETTTTGTAWATGVDYTSPGTIVLEDDVDEVLSASMRTLASGYDELPITLLSLEGYTETLTKSDTGSVCVGHVQYSNPRVLYLMNQPDGTTDKSIFMNVVIVQDRYETTDDRAALSTINRESFWNGAIVFSLAERLSYDYGIPLQERLTLKGKADLLIMKARGKEFRHSPSDKMTTGSYR